MTTRKATLDLWLLEKDELLAGHKHKEVRKRDRSIADRFTVRNACNAYLEAKEQRADDGEITRRHFNDLVAICSVLRDGLGATKAVKTLTPQDFGPLRATLSNRFGPAALLRTMICIRSVFKFAAANELIERPVCYGTMFDLPTKKDSRLQRASKPERLFSAAALQQLIGAAGPQMTAMILLGVNAGLGNSDCGQLEDRHLDLTGGWLNYPRVKTGIDRRAKLWPETIEAIRAAIAVRPSPKTEQHGALVFLTRCGEPWAKECRNNPVSQEFRKLLESAGLHRDRLGFYTLRHVFETIAGGTRDQVAVDSAMGHCDNSMGGLYREPIEDARLEAVSQHVHDWLYGAAKPAAKPKRKPAKKQEAKPERPALRIFG